MQKSQGSDSELGLPVVKGTWKTAPSLFAGGLGVAE